MDIRFAVFDVDGTIRDRDGIPDSAKAAIQRLKQNGVQLALCTGRGEYEAGPLREELGIDWAITCNGSHIGYKGETVFGQAFPQDLVVKWLQLAAQHGHAMLLSSSERLFNNHEDPALFRRAQEEIGFLEPQPIHTMLSLPEIYQCIVFCEEQDRDIYVHAAGSDQLYTHRWKPYAMDLNPPGVNKAKGLKQLLNHLDIPISETAAFGDGLNDLELITAAGIGIAMGNGIDEVKRQADFVTKPLREDGLAYAIERWILRTTPKEGDHNAIV